MSKVALEVQGKFAKLVIKGNKGNSKPRKRGKVGVFSAGARKRMSQLIATLGEAIPIFVTLTYGRKFPRDGEVWKRHLDVFLKRLKRKYPHLSAIWKLEPQKRFAPHYHLIVYGGRIDKDWLALAWAESSEDTSVDHIMAGTQVEAAKSSRAPAAYIAKYISKLVVEDLPEYWHSAGRWWGIHNRKMLPFAEKKTLFMASSVASLFTDFLADRLLSCKKQKFIRTNQSCPDVFRRAEVEVNLDKWDRPTSTYTENLAQLLDDFKMYSSGKATLHCLAKCRGSIEMAEKLCLRVMAGISDFISLSGVTGELA